MVFPMDFDIFNDFPMASPLFPTAFPTDSPQLPGGAPRLGRLPAADPAAVAGRLRGHRLERRCSWGGSNKRSVWGTHIPYPLVICYIAMENGPVEIVDFPIKNSDFL